jgi:hypothetical protein
MTTPTDSFHPDPDRTFVDARSDGSFRRLHFRDHRAPVELIAHLERLLMAVLHASMVEDRLVARARMRITGAHHEVRLHHDAAWSGEDGYRLEVDSSWAHLPQSSHEYFQNNTRSWFELWTHGFLPTCSTVDPDGSPEIRQHRIHAVLARELQLDDIAGVQHEILRSLRHGGSFITSHSEGGTRIRWNGLRFVRTDFGESGTITEFNGTAAFLEFLRRFFHQEVSRHCHPDPVPETDAWRLILRKLHANG